MKGKTRISDDFELTLDMREWGAMKFPQVDLDKATERFRDHYEARGTMFASWKAAWRNWIRQAVEYGRDLKSPVAQKQALEWVELKAAAQGMSFRPPFTGESPASYRTQMKRAQEDVPRGTILDFKSVLKRVQA